MGLFMPRYFVDVITGIRAYGITKTSRQHIPKSTWDGRQLVYKKTGESAPPGSVLDGIDIITKAVFDQSRPVCIFSGIRVPLDTPIGSIFNKQEVVTYAIHRRCSRKREKALQDEQVINLSEPALPASSASASASSPKRRRKTSNSQDPSEPAPAQWVEEEQEAFRTQLKKQSPDFLLPTASFNFFQTASTATPKISQSQEILPNPPKGKNK